MLASALLLWIGAGAILAGYFWRDALMPLWREPVLKRPVFVLESDDWGAGPLEQADQLRAIGTVLARHTDRDGRHPVMTLGVVLAVVDGAATGGTRCITYYRKSLASADLAPV